MLGFKTVKDVFIRLEADFVRFLDKDGVEVDMMAVDDSLHVLNVVDVDGEVTVTVDAKASDLTAA